MKFYATDCDRYKWHRYDKLEWGDNPPVDWDPQAWREDLEAPFDESVWSVAGTELHKFIENAIRGDGPVETGNLVGVFEETGKELPIRIMTEMDVPAVAFPELRIEGEILGHTFTGKLDGVDGNVGYDWKFQKRIDFKKLRDSWQWRIYLYLMPELEAFEFVVFHMKENKKEGCIEVVDKKGVERLYRYPALNDEVEDLVWEMSQAAKEVGWPGR